MTYLKEINGYILNNRSQNDNKYLRFFSNLVGEKDPRIPGVKDSSFFFKDFSTLSFIRLPNLQTEP